MTGPPLVADRYQLSRPLDRDRTWHAWDRMLQREVTLRRIDRTELTALRAVSRVRHPGLLIVHDVLTDGGQAWMVAELTDGATLADLPRPTEAQAAALGADVLGALSAVHGLGVLHGALGPHAVVRTSDGRLKLTGFGARPDERFLPAEGPALPASDVWGAAAMLSTAVEGRLPFPSREAVRAGMPPLPPLAAPRLGAALHPALAPDPAARPGTAALRRALRALAPPAPPPPSPRRRGPWRLHPAALAAIAVAWVTVIAVAAVTLSLPDGAATPSGDGTAPGRAVRVTAPDGGPVPARTRPFDAAPGACATLSDDQLRSLVPQPAAGRSVDAGQCSWWPAIDSQLDLPDRLSPSLSVRVELKPDPHQALQLDRELSAYTGKVRALAGLGDEAFVVSSSLAVSATRKPYEVEVHFRMANAVVTLKYDRTAGGPDPRMDDAATRAAGWVATALARA